jgi:hypothetical protein
MVKHELYINEGTVNTPFHLVAEVFDLASPVTIVAG